MPILPLPLTVQGPQGAGVSVPRTPIPVALSARTLPPMVIAGVAQPIVPPVAPPQPPVAGAFLRTTLDDWYYRIHVVPTIIALGNLSGDTTRSVLVWSAYFDPVSLDAVTLADTDGISLSSPVTPPTVIGPLRSLTYLVNVSSEGPSAIDTTITWTIDGVDYVVPVTGRRSVLFPFTPNWATAVQETLTWTTTVIRTWAGNEQRQSISRYPRRSMSYRFQVHNDDARLLDNILFGWQGRFYSLPLWHEESRLFNSAAAGSNVLSVDTTRMSIGIGSTLVLYASAGDFETVEVDAYGPGYINTKGDLVRAWGRGSKLIPCVSAIPQAALSTSRPLPHIAQASVDMQVDPSTLLLRLDGGAAPMSYRGEEMYLRETDWSDSLSVPVEANRRDTDNQIGPMRVLRKGEFPFIGRSYRWVNRDRASGDALRAFFARRQGRFSPFWAPSGTEDFILSEAIDPVATAITVRKTQFTSLVWPSTIRRDIIIKMRNGTTYARRVTDVADAPDASVLILDQGFGVAIDPADVKRISFLGLYRLAEDSVTFNWHTNHVSVVETDFILTEPDA